jgi:hypothetical protein
MEALQLKRLGAAGKRKEMRYRKAIRIAGFERFAEIDEQDRQRAGRIEEQKALCASLEEEATAINLRKAERLRASYRAGYSLAEAKADCLTAEERTRLREIHAEGRKLFNLQHPRDSVLCAQQIAEQSKGYRTAEIEYHRGRRGEGYVLRHLSNLNAKRIIGSAEPGQSFADAMETADQWVDEDPGRRCVIAPFKDLPVMGGRGGRHEQAQVGQPISYQLMPKMEEREACAKMMWESGEMSLVTARLAYESGQKLSEEQRRRRLEEADKEHAAQQQINAERAKEREEDRLVRLAVLAAREEVTA